MATRFRPFKGGLVSGTTLVSLGLIFLLDNLNIVDISLIWPIVPIGMGIALILRYYLTPPEATGSDLEQDSSKL